MFFSSKIARVSRLDSYSLHFSSPSPAVPPVVAWIAWAAAAAEAAPAASPKWLKEEQPEVPGSEDQGPLP